ncbi:histidine--tRNA ligase [Marivirga tractuosa]|uniref:Histidine--tRNA ligase n=1 Tax=Marivirga tractuosa (strain ATCC 23168 / DSM 4126 / NBRC 15989 / NCIMB 1408 / VKM B-1430 / H-43) TaxID=643867 RepID=E4TNR6_MARTH|nr:histidine--tRNA ligase [Marivirga tractuosa]ADR21503.1 histidyl-tRNA synthetase [Marivirga tractuosa DSM 4126]BDD14043.1 histidine--tRNA ligase [Marivirga tractuosa]
MSKNKPSIPKGTRDFGPAEMAKRHFILDTIKKVYQKYGYAPIETPAMENLSVLQGKYGDEGDQLLFKILNSGDFLSKTDESDRSDSKALQPKISEKGLRYDLTVPFARFVVMHQHNLTFPFKRYQIQPVWRADRPQKGRYREFYQCDADAIGTNSMLCEAEIVLMIQEVFKSLQTKKANSLDYAIKINNRKILSGIVEVMGAEGKETDFAVAIDKLDKIGEDKVKEELLERGFNQSSIDTLSPLFTLSGDNTEQLNFLKDFLKNSEKGQKGLEELNEVFDILDSFGAKVPQLELDVTLARGLSYYTGAIFEVKPKNVEMGSICGGGRYDGLTDTFGLPDVSGVGISFGVDRIYDVLEELDLYPENAESSTEVLMVSFDEESWKYSLKVLHRLRTANVKAELYPEPVKLKKQMKYANDKQIPFVILVGSEEMKTGDLTFKNMKEGTQESLNAESILKRFLGYE